MKFLCNLISFPRAVVEMIEDAKFHKETFSEWSQRIHKENMMKPIINYVDESIDNNDIDVANSTIPFVEWYLGDSSKEVKKLKKKLKNKINK
jgi:ferritin